MRAAPLPLAALAALTLGVSLGLPARKDFEMAAQLDWRQQIPRPVRPIRAATGFLSGDLNHESRTVDWKLVYARLSGPATAAHVHVGKRGVRGPVVLYLCGERARRCKSGLHGTAVVRPTTVESLEAGTAYVDLHTRRSRAGEIRGQIAVKR
jgi:CHRD domain